MLLTAEPDDIALEVIQALLGHRWVWPFRTVTEVYQVRQSNTLFLTGRPAREIAAVTDKDGTAISCTYTVMGGYALIIGGKYCTVHSQCNGLRYCEVWVTYEFGSQPPPAVCRAVDVLSEEIRLAHNGEACRLPERVTSVSRQGVSWTLLDPQDFLTEGRTGIYEVDLVLSMYTGPNRVQARARVWTPDNMPPIRVEVDGLPITSYPTP